MSPGANLQSESSLWTSRNSIEVRDPGKQVEEAIKQPGGDVRAESPEMLRGGEQSRGYA